jgi:hypothetical protein
VQRVERLPHAQALWAATYQVGKQLSLQLER